MALTVEASIMQALFTRVDALVLSPALEVAWPNQTFNPPQSGGKPAAYLRVGFFPNGTNRVMIDSNGPHRLLGLMQVSVMWPKDQGEQAARDVAGAIVAHFPCDSKMTADGVVVRVTARPEVTDIIVETTRVQIPVMIPWEVWA